MKANKTTWQLVEDLKRTCELKDLTGILIIIGLLCKNLDVYPVKENKRENSHDR